MLFRECVLVAFKNRFLRGKIIRFFEFCPFTGPKLRNVAQVCFNSLSDKNTNKTLHKDHPTHLSFASTIMVLPHGNHPSNAEEKYVVSRWLLVCFNCRRSKVVMCFANNRSSLCRWMNCSQDRMCRIPLQRFICSIFLSILFEVCRIECMPKWDQLFIANLHIVDFAIRVLCCGVWM